MCRVLGVKRNGYYGYWRRINDVPVDWLHEEMIKAVKEIAKDSQYSYGTRRIKCAMKARGFPISRSKARKNHSVNTSEEHGCQEGNTNDALRN